MTAGPGYQAAEARLPALDEAALEQVTPRQRQILLAMAALHHGERARVVAAVQAARDAGEHDIAWILELMAAPDETASTRSPRKTARDLPGVAEIPEILQALHAWRSGATPRGTAALRRLAAGRPALGALLDVLGKRKSISWSGLERLSPRAPAVLAAAYVSIHKPGADLAAAVQRLLPDQPLDLASYHNTRHPLEQWPWLHRWAQDPRVVWGHDQSLSLMQPLLRDRNVVAPVLSALLLALHRRLLAGQARSLLAPIHACLQLAHIAAPTLVGPLAVLTRRLGGLLDPMHELPTLLTLWRRSATGPQRERLTIALAVVNAAQHILQDEGEDEPLLALPFVCEALAYLIAHTDDAEMQVQWLDDLGWLLPDAKYSELLAALDPATRSYLLGQRALTEMRYDEALDAVVSLAQVPTASKRTGKLLSRVLDELYDRRLAPRVLRHFERMVAALLAVPALDLDSELLPLLLATTRDLNAGVEPARALVRRVLERPLADSDPRAAQHLLARHLLGDAAGAQEHVRRLGRWLRAAPPDAADDLALGIIAGVFNGLDLAGDPDALVRLVAPLSSFLLRDGPERPQRAATRAQAMDPARIRGYAAWAREHVDKLGGDRFWRSLILLADELDDLEEADADDLEIPF